MDGAEKVLRAAIEAYPGHVSANTRFGSLLYTRAARAEENGGADQSNAAVYLRLYEEAARHLNIGLGAGNEWTRRAALGAARQRAALAQAQAGRRQRKKAGEGKGGAEEKEGP